MDPCCSSAQKRKAAQLNDDQLNLSSDEQNCKRRALDIDANDAGQTELLSLPDDVLYIILSSLHPRDRLEMSLYEHIYIISILF